MKPTLRALASAGLLLTPGLLAADAAKPATSPSSSLFAPGEQGKRFNQVLEPTPKNGWPVEPTTNGGAMVYKLLRQALTEYWKGKPAEGDRFVIEIKPTLRDATRRGKSGYDFVFGNMYAFTRLVFLFGKDGRHAPGRMSAEAEATAKEIFWTWLEPRACQALVDPAKDWWHWGTENHNLIMWVGLWSTLKILVADPNYAGRTFADGSTVAQLAKGFDDYYKRLFRHRAGRGLFIETGSTYLNYSIAALYNVVDFADDPELRRVSREFLDLVWAQWALEQIGGFRGGSRHRSYMTKEAAFLTSPLQGLGWIHFGVGKQTGPHPTVIFPATTSYVPSPLMQEIARKRTELGDYQIVSRQLGRFDPNQTNIVHYGTDPKSQMYGDEERGGIWQIDPQCRSVLRKTYATPGFVMGCSMVEFLPFEKWLPISAQNRRDGVMFAGGAAGTSLVIFVQPFATKSFMNAQWSVQDKGVLIVQRLAKQRGIEKDAGNETVWFSKDLTRVEKDGWIFVEAPAAYAAVKVVNGGWTWKTEADAEKLGQRLYLKNPFSPILIEVVPKRAYASFEDFQKAVLANHLSHSAHRLDYTSRHYQTTLTLFTDYSRSPMINRKAVNFESPKGFDGEVLNADFGGDTVTLKAFGKEQVFNFKTAP